MEEVLMKKVTIMLIIILFLATFALPVIAAKEDSGVHADITVAAARTQTTSSGELEKNHGEDDTVTVTPTTRETVDGERHGTGSGIEDSKNKSGRTISEVREDHNKSHESLNATLRNVSSGERDRIKNENEVRLAVNTLLETEDLSGGIGRNVSAIARDFNNSASSARQLEDRIQTRNSFIRLLFGGDRDAARELANLTARNQARIVELHQLMSSATLDAEVRAMMEDQVRIMQKEQDRLQQLADTAGGDRGLFGWFW
jgi:uncharacterized protein (DUF885 family)